ncbi:MAG: metallophosphoesterase [Bacteroidetes bacterium]|nr:metallophosphoesterase [Bacteroidota bacterium]
MIFGVLSDIHDNLTNLDRALQLLKAKGAEALIFCGDFCAPFAAVKLAESGLPVHAVFGNNDGDRFAIRNLTSGFQNFTLYGEYIGDTPNPLELDSVKIGVTHYPFYAKPLIKTGWYDCVFFGHSHKAEKQKYGQNLLLNPGEIAGIFGQPSFAVLDTALRSSEIVYF